MRLAPRRGGADEVAEAQRGVAVAGARRGGEVVGRAREDDARVLQLGVAARVGHALRQRACRRRSVTGARRAAQRALDGAGRPHAAPRRARVVVRAARRQRQRRRAAARTADHGRIVEWPGCAARPTTARSCGWRCPALGALAAEPLYLLVDTAIVGHLGTPQLAALALAATVLSAPSSRCASSSPTGRPRRSRACTAPGRTARRRARGAGAVARARRSASCSSPPCVRRWPTRSCTRSAATATSPTWPRATCASRARRAVRAHRARRPGLPARRGRPAHAAGHRRRRQRRQRRPRGALRLRLRLGPRRLGLGHGHRAARDGRSRSRPCCCAPVAPPRPRAHPLAGAMGAPARRPHRARCWPLRARHRGLRARRRGDPRGATRSPSSSSSSSRSCSTRSRSPARSSSGARSAPATPTRPSPPARRMIELALVAGLVFGGVLLALVGRDPARLHLRPGRHRPRNELWPLFALMQPVAAVVFALDGILIGAGDTRYLAAAMVVAPSWPSLPIVLPAADRRRRVGGARRADARAPGHPGRALRPPALGARRRPGLVGRGLQRRGQREALARAALLDRRR